MKASAQPFGPHDRLPDFVLPEAGAGLCRFYGVAGGRPTVLVFGEDPTWAQDLERALPAWVVVHWVSPRATSSALSRGRTFVDADRTLGPLLPDPRGSWAWVLDANLRVTAGFGPGDQAALQASLQSPEDTPRSVRRQAPVLLIPEALEPETCRALIEHFETAGHAPTGVEQSSAGRRHLAMALEQKRRSDHVVSDPELLEELTKLVGRRIVPEVQLAFSFRATRFEGFKLVAYGPGGMFVPHRDNLSPNTAHRRFALTLNLNDDYQGGELAFPEYGPDLYRPGRGGAVVFSCSLLHEVRPVEHGVRHALLSFLFSGEDKRRAPA